MAKRNGWKFALSRLFPLKSSRVYTDLEDLTSQNAIDVLPDPICVINRLGRITQMNGAFDSLLDAHPLDYLHSHITEDSKYLLEEALASILNDGALYQKVDLAFITSSIRSGANISTYDWQIRRNEKSTMIMLLGRYDLFILKD